MQHNFKDLTGRTFGYLTVKGLAPSADSGRKTKTCWSCVCVCGATVKKYAKHLQDDSTQSCGCKRKETLAKRSTKHGASANGKLTREYKAWTRVKRRCTDLTNPNYGGRGISVCDKWKHDFDAFLKDMGPCPHGCSIDRIDVNGNYEPGNCRWATDEEQAANKRPYTRKPKDVVILFGSGVSVDEAILKKSGGVNVWLIEASLIASDKEYATQVWKSFPPHLRFYVEAYMEPDWVAFVKESKCV